MRRGRRKLSFGLSIKQQEINCPGEGTLSSEQSMGKFLEEVGLSWDFQEWDSGAGASEKQPDLLLSWFLW